MLYKLSKLYTNVNCGIFLVKIIHIYNKRRYIICKKSGFTKNTLVEYQTKQLRFFSKKIKGFVTHTINNNNKIDTAKIIFFNNFIYITKKFKKKKNINIFGCIKKNIKIKKYLYKFKKIL